MTCVPGYLSNPPRLQGLPDSAASHNRSRLNDSGRGGVRSSVYNVEFVRQLSSAILDLHWRPYESGGLSGIVLL